MALRVAPDDSTSRVLTIPNVITIVRLACLPVFLWLLFVQEDREDEWWSALMTVT